MRRAILAAGFLAATALTWADETPPRIWVGVDPEATERLHGMLLQETISQVDFHETRLGEVLDHLSELIGHQIRIDALALDELGLGPDEPVTIKAKNLRLGAVLQLMLEPLELTCLVQDGSLIVSTEDVALTRCKTAIYPVGDLLIQDEKDGPDYRSLIALITATIASDTWALSGGGEATVWPYPQRAVLVVTTTSGIHEEIGEFLAALRKMPIDPKAKTLSHDEWYAPHGDRSVARGRGGRTGSRGGFGGGGGFGFGGGGGGFGYGGVDDEGAYGGGGGSFSPRAVEEPRTRLVPVVTEK